MTVIALSFSCGVSAGDTRHLVFQLQSARHRVLSDGVSDYTLVCVLLIVTQHLRPRRSELLSRLREGSILHS
jgi:hypothetical protein